MDLVSLSIKIFRLRMSLVVSLNHLPLGLPMMWMKCVCMIFIMIRDRLKFDNLLSKMLLRNVMEIIRFCIVLFGHVMLEWSVLLRGWEKRYFTITCISLDLVS